MTQNGVTLPGAPRAAGDEHNAVDAIDVVVELGKPSVNRMIADLARGKEITRAALAQVCSTNTLIGRGRQMRNARYPECRL